MDFDPRYEILGEIASGDFATVYEGRDRELGRMVAVKQIHHHFLTDARQLERYWQEAQLLASLQHGHIMTIYDIVRSRGWLILELLQSNLHQLARGEPLDLDFLRVVLTHSLLGLKFLHDNGVVHGDIKPTNLFVDRRNSVKLGDFGLARRVSNDQGSLLKGTTRYMAPELVSQQFGPVGPASDLYSLGFSAYELMCGPQFDTLFPGLEAFGRDKQIAWMMWHAAPDRKLPEISRVLAGVPEDLSHVIQKLVAKNPAERYRTADEALADLRAASDNPDPFPGAEDEALRARRAKRRNIIGIAATFMASLLIMVVLAIVNGGKKPVPIVKPPPPIAGVVRNLLPEKKTMVLEVEGEQMPRELVLREQDRVFLNGTPSLLRDLHEGDRIIVKKLRDAANRPLNEIVASRPQRNQGVIKSMLTDEGRMIVEISGAEGPSELKLSVPVTLAIRFNNDTKLNGRPVALADLQPGDQIVAEHDADDSGRVATSLTATRGVTEQGVLRSLDARKSEVTIALGDSNDAQLATWPLGAKCEVTLNTRRFLGGELLKPSVLAPGDKVTLVHDTHVLRIDAFRVFQESGVLAALRPENRVIDIAIENPKRMLSCTIGPKCTIQLGEVTVELDELRRGDRVTVTHDSPDTKSPELLTVAATRAVDSRLWAVLIAVQSYEDTSLAPLPYAKADAELLRQTLTSRAGFDKEHVLTLLDDSRVRIEQSVPAFVEKVPSDAQLVVYYVGHAYAAEDGQIFLAPRDFSLQRIAATGLPLKWLVGLLELLPLKEKLLLLDACHAGTSADLKQEPSSLEMLETLRTPNALSPLRSLTAIASCGLNQRGRDDSAQQHGAFALAAARALTGRGDKNLDNRLEPTELFEYTATQLAALPGTPAQTPVLVLPNDTPPRLSQKAKDAINRLATQLMQPKIDLKKTAADFAEARELALKEPEPSLVYGLALLKAKKEPEALRHFDEMKLQHDQLLLPWEAAAWVRFRQQDYTGGTADLVQLAQRIVDPKRDPPLDPPHAARVMTWVGKLREFAGIATPEDRRPQPAVLEGLDAAAASASDELQKSYAQGRAASTAVAVDFDKRIREAPDKAAELTLQLNRRALTNYTTFPGAEETAKVLEMIER